MFPDSGDKKVSTAITGGNHGKSRRPWSGFSTEMLILCELLGTLKLSAVISD